MTLRPNPILRGAIFRTHNVILTILIFKLFPGSRRPWTSVIPLHRSTFTLEKVKGHQKLLRIIGGAKDKQLASLLTLYHKARWWLIQSFRTSLLHPSQRLKIIKNRRKCPQKCASRYSCAHLARFEMVSYQLIGRGSFTIGLIMVMIMGWQGQWLVTEVGWEEGLRFILVFKC